MWISVGPEYQETGYSLGVLIFPGCSLLIWANLFGLGEDLGVAQGEDPGKTKSPSSTHWLIRP